MNAVAKIRRAGFDVALDGGRLKVVRASKLTTEQRSFIATHKAELIAELIAELQQADSPTGVSVTGNVCCANCRHSVLPPQTEKVYGWRLCGLGVKDGGGFGKAIRQCDSYLGDPAMESDALAERAAILEYDAGLTRQQADRAIELMASGWALWNAVARCRSESLPDWNWKPTS